MAARLAYRPAINGPLSESIDDRKTNLGPPHSMWLSREREDALAEGHHDMLDNASTSPE